MANEKFFPHRAALSFDDAVEVWHLRWRGLYQSQIAAHFHTAQARVSEVLRGQSHVGSREVALRLLREGKS